MFGYLNRLHISFGAVDIRSYLRRCSHVDIRMESEQLTCEIVRSRGTIISVGEMGWILYIVMA